MKEVSFIRGAGESTDLVPLLAGRENCDPSHSFGPEMREYFVIHFCVSGKGSFTTSRGTYDIGAGQIFIIRPGEVVSYVADRTDPWTYIWISFTGTRSDALVPHADVLPFTQPTFLRLAELVSAGENTAAIYLSSLYEIIHYLPGTGGDGEGTVRSQVRRYIDLNYMESLEVESIADLFGFDRRYLSRCFKSEYGVSIKEYITSVRIRRAKDFLAEGFSVAEVAAMVGYTDTFGFSRMFKKITGVAPSSCRKK